MASQITSLTIVYSTVYPSPDQRKHQSWPLWGDFTSHRWISNKKASNAENVSIWWRYHKNIIIYKKHQSHSSPVTSSDYPPGIIMHEVFPRDDVIVMLYLCNDSNVIIIIQYTLNALHTIYNFFYLKSLNKSSKFVINTVIISLEWFENNDGCVPR